MDDEALARIGREAEIAEAAKSNRWARYAMNRWDDFDADVKEIRLAGVRAIRSALTDGARQPGAEEGRGE